MAAPPVTLIGLEPAMTSNEKAEIVTPPPVSAFAHLTKLQAVKVFRKATMLCFFAGLCVLMEGYQGQITGKSSCDVGLASS